MQTKTGNASQDQLTRRIANRWAKRVLAVIAVLVFLYAAMTAPFWLFAIGWYDSTRASRYGECLACMPPDLAREMPQSVPPSARDVRMHYHAGMLQARHWLELRFVVPVDEAARIASEARKVQDAIGTAGWDMERSCLARLATLDDRNEKTPPPATAHCYMLAHQKNRMGFAAVAVDTVTGEVVYCACPD